MTRTAVAALAVVAVARRNCPGAAADRVHAHEPAPRGRADSPRERAAGRPAASPFQAPRRRTPRAGSRSRPRSRRHRPSRSASRSASSCRSGSRPAPRTGSRGRCSPRSTRSSPTSARTWARAPRARSAGCSSCRTPGSAGARTPNGDGVADPWTADRRDLLGGALPRGRGRPDGHPPRRLRLQPRRLVRERGARPGARLRPGRSGADRGSPARPGSPCSRRGSASRARTGPPCAADLSVLRLRKQARSSTPGRTRRSSSPTASPPIARPSSSTARCATRLSRRSTARRARPRRGTSSPRRTRNASAPSFSPGRGDADGRAVLLRRLRVPRRRRPAGRLGRALAPRLPGRGHRRPRRLARCTRSPTASSSAPGHGIDSRCGIGFTMHAFDGQVWTYCHMAYREPDVDRGRGAPCRTARRPRREHRPRDRPAPPSAAPAGDGRTRRARPGSRASPGRPSSGRTRRRRCDRSKPFPLLRRRVFSRRRRRGSGDRLHPLRG